MKASTERFRWTVRGQVQGVGFRPFIYRVAVSLRLSGTVANNSTGAVIEAEGAPQTLDEFEGRITSELPPLAHITELTREPAAPKGEDGFRIIASQRETATSVEVTPDAATCPDCLRELLDPGDRRYRYPFINCTNCGPRYSIIRSVPYDRPATTMAIFPMCPDCEREYGDPADRRFHAQPNACPVCGPHLALVASEACRREQPSAWHPAGHPAPKGTAQEQWHTDASDPKPVTPPAVILSGAKDLASSPGDDHACVQAAAGMLREGKILAIKGIGGYHLACRADAEDVVARLRARKLRDGKPLAVMVPDLESAKHLCRLSDADIAALTSPAAPIVLAPQRPDHGLAPSIAPGCRDFGVMLPYAPLHHVLFAEGLGPLVMTSANIAGQPLTYEDDDALATLSDVADAFLAHNRPIYRPIDDSVVYTHAGQTVPIRRARGYAPRPIRLGALPAARNDEDRPRILAVGGELKSVIGLCARGEVILSEHLGELTNPQAYRHFVEAIERLSALYEFSPDLAACDLHPQYLSTQYAERLGVPVTHVQHHHAHIASVLAEHDEAGPAIGLACDGTGHGTDGAVWGCEILWCDRAVWRRAGQLEYFSLVGGDAAAVETWRPAAALLRSAFGDEWRGLFEKRFATRAVQTPQSLALFEQQAARGVNAPSTSSLGRVFDGVSFLLGLCERNRHEAEAAMALESAASERHCSRSAAHGKSGTPFAYDIHEESGYLQLSLRATMREMLDALDRGDDPRDLAARFHETIAAMLADGAARAAEVCGVRTVALSGGCFANRRLLAGVTERLSQRGLRVLSQRVVPCGDGGLALGQAAIAAWQTQAPRP